MSRVMKVSYPNVYVCYLQRRVAMMNVMCKTLSDDYVEESGDNVYGV